MLFRKKTASAPSVTYHADREDPVLRCSICTGEQVAGFKDRETGHFTEAALIRSDRDLEAFRKMYGITEIKKEY